MPANDECRTCAYSQRCNRADRARAMRCKDYKESRNLKNETVRRNKHENSK